MSNKNAKGYVPPMTDKEFRDLVYSLVGDEYTVLGKYVKTDVKIKMRHNTCGHQYEVTPNKFQQGRRCPKCYGNKERTLESFREEIKNLPDGDEYELLSVECKDNKTPMEFFHKICGEKFKKPTVGFLTNPKNKANTRCPICSRQYQVINHPNRLSYEDVKKIVETKHSGEYKLLSDNYKNTKSLIKILHIGGCGRDFDTDIDHFKRKDYKCPRCNESVGEQRVRKVLESRNIEFIQQYRFKDCRDKNPLPFDFYIPAYDLCIEFDGIQHYEKANFGSYAADLDTIQLHDEIKTNYCLDNNIGLIRISYKDFDNLEKVLKKDLNEYLKELDI